MKLRYERGALDDLEEIFAHVAKDSRDAARRLVNRVEEVVAAIAEFPHLGEPTRSADFRKVPIGKYLIVYKVERNEVIILYIRHGARMRPWERE